MTDHIQENTESDINLLDLLIALGQEKWTLIVVTFLAAITGVVMSLITPATYVSRTSIMALAGSLPRDGQEIQSMNYQNMHFSMMNKNINPRGANPLLNPFAWAQFMQQIFKGDKERDKN